MRVRVFAMTVQNKACVVGRKYVDVSIDNKHNLIARTAVVLGEYH